MRAPKPPESRRRSVELARLPKKPSAEIAGIWGSRSHACAVDGT